MNEPGPSITMTFDMLRHKNEYSLALHGAVFYLTLYEIDQELRTHIKHDDKLDEHATQVLEELREMIYECSAFNEID